MYELCVWSPAYSLNHEPEPLSSMSFETQHKLQALLSTKVGRLNSVPERKLPMCMSEHSKEECSHRQRRSCWKGGDLKESYSQVESVVS